MYNDINWILYTNVIFFCLKIYQNLIIIILYLCLDCRLVDCQQPIQCLHGSYIPVGECCSVCKPGNVIVQPYVSLMSRLFVLQDYLRNVLST
jgi:hypothetical protein